MHNKTYNFNVFCVGGKEFNVSLLELKEFLGFKISILKDINNSDPNIKNSIILIDSDFIESYNTKKINDLKCKYKLLINNSKDCKKLIIDEKLISPFFINDLKKKIIKIFTSQKFNQNSSIQIKDYILDKNEKKLKKDNLYIVVTEKEIQLIELLFSTSKPSTKKEILNSVWNYSSDADSHTVETHIYRLRKKISDKFNDTGIIKSEKEGYTIWKKEIKLQKIYTLLNIEKEL